MLMNNLVLIKEYRKNINKFCFKNKIYIHPLAFSLSKCKYFLALELLI